MEKKVNITKEFYKKLINDMDSWDFKNDKQDFKQNEFFTTVILNTHKYRMINKNNLVEQIKDTLLDIDNSLPYNPITNAIKNLKNESEFEKSIIDLAIQLSTKAYSQEKVTSNNKKSIFVRGTKTTNDKLEEILNSSKDVSNASVFKNLLHEYMTYPMYIREKIVYLDFFEKLEYLKENNLKCIIESKKKYKRFDTGEEYTNRFEFEIYDIIPGTEEYHYYIVGIAKKENFNVEKQTISIKLSSIKKIISTNSTYLISKETVDEIKEKLEKGPEWMGGEFKNIDVEFTEFGLKLFKYLYKDRPSFESNENNIYHFYCNPRALMNYLKAFGRHAKILSPIECKEKLLDFYRKAYNCYNEEQE